MEIPEVPSPGALAGTGTGEMISDLVVQLTTDLFSLEEGSELLEGSTPSEQSAGQQPQQDADLIQFTPRQPSPVEFIQQTMQATLEQSVDHSPSSSHTQPLERVEPSTNFLERIRSPYLADTASTSRVESFGSPVAPQSIDTGAKAFSESLDHKDPITRRHSASSLAPADIAEQERAERLMHLIDRSRPLSPSLTATTSQGELATNNQLPLTATTSPGELATNNQGETGASEPVIGAPSTPSIDIEGVRQQLSVASSLFRLLPK